MTRRDERDAIVRIIFQRSFFPAKKMGDQTEEYLKGLKEEEKVFRSSMYEESEEDGFIRADASDDKNTNENPDEKNPKGADKGLDKNSNKESNTDLNADLIKRSEEADEKSYTYIREKVENILNRLPEIDELLESASKDWKVSRLGKMELAILRVAAYEIRFDPEIPEKVAVNEAIELSKVYCDDKAPSFINGVLDHLLTGDQG